MHHDLHQSLLVALHCHMLLLLNSQPLWCCHLQFPSLDCCKANITQPTSRCKTIQLIQFMKNLWQIFWLPEILKFTFNQSPKSQSSSNTELFFSSLETQVEVWIGITWQGSSARDNLRYWAVLLQNLLPIPAHSSRVLLPPAKMNRQFHHKNRLTTAYAIESPLHAS